jgi:hypothetical protein
MWHKSAGITMGLQLKATGTLKYLSGVTETKSLNASYYDLADPLGNIVGKVFYGLKIFLIEDQELLFAMSYKSNRSWTLPDYGVDINANVTFGCPACLLQYTVTTIPPTSIGGDDGQIIVSGITNSSLDSVPPKPVILEILSGGTGQTGGTKVFFEEVTGDTIVTNADTLNGFGLSAATYTVKLIDTGFVDCIVPSEVNLSANTSTLAAINIRSTYAGLNSMFRIGAYAGNPTRIRLYKDNAVSIGFPLGIAYVTVGPTGLTNTDLATRYGLGAGTTGNDALTKWTPITGSYLEMTNLSFGEEYDVYLRDATGGTFSDIALSDAISAQTWTYYVAVANPFSDTEDDMSVVKGTDGGGQYATLSNYLDLPLNPSTNPIVGVIEASLHPQGEIPTEWVDAGTSGNPVKIYAPVGASGTYEMSVRERKGYIVMYEPTAEDTVTF